MATDINTTTQNLNDSTTKPPDPSTALLMLTPDDVLVLSPKVQWAVARYWRTAGALDQAQLLLDQIKLHSGESLTWLEERARLAYVAGDFAEALQLLQRRAHQSSSATAQAAVARLCLEIGDIETAAQISSALVSNRPELVIVANLAASVALAFGETEIARSYYLGLLDTKPESLTAFIELIRLSLTEQDNTTANNFLHRALAIVTERTTPNQLRTLAELCEQLGDTQRARVLRTKSDEAEAERSRNLFTRVCDEIGPPEHWPSRKTSQSRITNHQSSALSTSTESEASSTVSHKNKQLESRSSPTSNHIANVSDISPELRDILQQQFGYSALRPGQAAVIANVITGRDILAIMPTGAGKSLTFQLPAMILPGITLVISPLISLMKDQVDKLPRAIRERTTLINSTLAVEDMRQALIDIENGVYKLIYIAPERLRHHAFLRAIRHVGVSLIVVDEAHCISMWGHDFRPDYLSIPRALPELGNPHVLALTATATPTIVEQISAGFERHLELIRVSVFRPNLYYEVHHHPNREAKVADAIDIARRERGNGIVYVPSRKDAESIAGILRDRGVSALPYHAGLAQDVRAHNQELFMQGKARVVVATVAFGMGVDKANVRFIVHLAPPPSLAAYAQESGRAGRDGQRARCVLLISSSDQATLNRNATRDEISIDTLRKVYAGLKRIANNRWAIAEPDTLLTYSYDEDIVEADPRIALGVLEQARLIRRHPDTPVGYSLLGLNQTKSTADTTEEHANWQRFLDWLGPDQSYATAIRTAETCTALGFTPQELDRLLNDQAGLTVRNGPRLTCIELLPVTGDVSARLNQLLERSRADARRRIRQVIDYANGERCRHVTLAAHLGEQIPACGSSCDICTGTADETDRTANSSTRSTTTAADALAVLKAVHTLPFDMGKTGLVRLLTGSVESRVRSDRSASFGVLKAVKKSRVEALVDNLVEDGFLHRDLDHEFKIIQLTGKGATAKLDDLADFEPERFSPTPQNRSVPVTTSTTTETRDLTPADHALLEALYEWRRQRAAADAVPAFTVAHNSTLRNLAVARPRTLQQLLEIHGFGPASADKYGSELLDVIARF